MTAVLVVASVAPRTESDVVAANGTDCDLIELRLDTPARSDVAAALAALDKPAIVTCRRRMDGGLEVLDEETRRAALTAGLDAGASFVDIEDDAPFRRDLAALAHRKNARVIVSHHALAGTPDAKSCLARLRAMREGADIVKLATRATRPEDVATLLDVALEAPTLGVPFTVMGVGDATLRAAAGALDMALVYAAAGTAVAAGQLPVGVQARLPGAPPIGWNSWNSRNSRNSQDSGRSTDPLDLVLVGHPVTHSLSPRMQNAALAHIGRLATYRAIDVAPQGFPEALRALSTLGCAGGNITTPHKDAAFAACHETTPEAQAAQAVNTFVLRGERMLGHITDGIGAVEVLAARGEAPRGRAVVVAGAGGTARAVAHALARAGAQLTLTNRTQERVAPIATRLGCKAVALAEADLRSVLLKDSILVNCTPADLPVPDATLGRIVTLDAGYGAQRGALARRARAAGGRVVDGIDLLVFQGFHALAFWLGSPPREPVRHVMAASARTGELEDLFARGAHAAR